MSTEIWYKNPKVILKNEYILELWPKKNFSLERQINSIIRLIILLTFCAFILTFKYNFFLLGLVCILVISILYHFKTNSKEGLINNINRVKPILGNPFVYQINKDNFSQPTEKNPLMNVLIPEVKDNPCRKSAGPTFNPIVEKQINQSVKSLVTDNFDNKKNIKKDLFGSLGEQLNLDRAMQRFTATANTQIPNDQNAFLKYTYSNLALERDWLKDSLDNSGEETMVPRGS